MSGLGAGRGSIGELDFGMGRALVPLSPFPRAAFLADSPRTRFRPPGAGRICGPPGPRRFRWFAALACFVGLMPSMSLITL